MRIGVIAVLLLGLVAEAGAQSREQNDDVPQSSIGLPLPQIGLPLPSIGLPLPPMGLPPQQPKPTIFDEPRQVRAPHDRRDRVDHRSGGVVFLYVPAYDWQYLPGTPVPSLPSPPPEQPVTGLLIIELQPDVDPQIFVDGSFVGSMSDLGGEVTDQVGVHTIELRQEGYETLHVDVEFRGDQIATYRGELRPVEPAPLSAPAPEPPPTTIYVIPGCYVGNIPPAEAALPAGCNARSTVVFPSR